MTNIADYQLKLDNFHGIGVQVASGEYEGCNSYLQHTCSICNHVWMKRPAMFKTNCPGCSTKNKPKITSEQYQKRLDDMFGEGLIVAIEPYIASYKSILHRCGICSHEWLKTPNAPTGCPECARIGKSLSLEDYAESCSAVNIKLLATQVLPVMSVQCLQCSKVFDKTAKLIRAKTKCVYCTNSRFDAEDY
ncbi:hypothetical protein, partial [Escherichia coli]|uniref:hypothetical protein n=1 Tax=Escherichia coli TaxID=562 RepID=UPI0010F7400B